MQALPRTQAKVNAMTDKTNPFLDFDYRKFLGNLTVPGVDTNDLVAAQQTMGEILLRRQFVDFKAGLPVSGFVDPKHLSRRDRARLREAFKAIEGHADHILVPITVDFDLHDGLHRIQICFLGFGQWTGRAVRTF